MEQKGTSNGIKYLMVTPDRRLTIPSVEFVRTVITKQGRKSILPVVTDCTHIYGAVYTASKVNKVVSIMICGFEATQLENSSCSTFRKSPQDPTLLYDMNLLEVKLPGEVEDYSKV
uniref:Uncharacterized protein n=1 Tax=Glossina brevipalpis TaxID=37001 RepID=A0A1A9W3I1_9MUSC